MLPQPTWSERVQKKRAEAEKIPEDWLLPEEILSSAHKDANINVMSIPSSCGILTQVEVDITENYDAVSLLERLRSRDLTTYQVTLAFCKRAAIAQQLVNCLTETFFQSALKRARELDIYLQNTGETVGAFHGLPISVKDTFNVKGVPATIGYVSFIGAPATFNSPLITLLKQQGAVLYVKTNVPQTLFAPDSNNNVFGRTLNPHNLALTAGGSSGGEGALVALGGSVLGVGSDMAGSIRIPAMCNGVFGFKPTEHRVPYDGQARPDKPGIPGPIYPVAGPIGRSARDMTLFMRTVMNGEPWKVDFMSPPIPWRPVKITPRLRVGFIAECPSCRVLPPMKTTLEWAAQLIQKAGHEIVPLSSFPSFQNGHDLSYRLFDLDNDETGLRHIAESGEPFVEATKDLNPLYPGVRKPRELEELWTYNAERFDIMREWHRIFTSNRLDVLLAPGFKTSAVLHDTMRSSPYMVMWNLVNYPAGIIPIPRCLVPEKDTDGIEVNADENQNQNAPYHVQLVAPLFRDEELAAAMEILSGILI